MTDGPAPDRFDDAEAVIERTNPWAARYLIYTLTLMAATGLVYGLSAFSPLRVLWAYLFPLLLCQSIFLGAMVLWRGPSPLPRGTFFVGALVIFGSTALDAAATYTHSPDLQQEANPLLRALLEAGHSLPFIYAYAVVFALIYVAMACVGWAGFLRHREALVRSALAQSPGTFGEFLRAAMGGGHLTPRRFWLSVRLSDCAKAYHAVCFLWAVAPVSWSIARWYAGLVWLDLVPNALGVVAVVSTVGSIAGYLLWLRRAWARGCDRCSHPIPPPGRI